jgi:TetR/AcrR family transcriptional regulator
MTFTRKTTRRRNDPEPDESSEQLTNATAALPGRKTVRRRNDPGLNESAEQLINATATLLSKRSDLNVSLADIATFSGLNSALIKYYFKNKEGLLLALLERDARIHMDGLARLLAMEVSAEEKLRIHIAAIFRAYYRSPYLNRLIHFMVEHAEPALAARVSEIFVNPIHVAYAAILDQGVREGVFARIDSGLLYFSLIGACDHIFVSSQSVEAVTGHATMTKKLMQAYIAHVTDIFLRGISVGATQENRRRSTQPRAAKK